MSHLMKQAILKARKLPEADQEALASIMLQEIEAEQRWDELFARPESADRSILLNRSSRRAWGCTTGRWESARETTSTGSGSARTRSTIAF